MGLHVREIIKIFPEHTHYVEPFPSFESMFMVFQPIGVGTFNDCNNDLISLVYNMDNDFVQVIDKYRELFFNNNIDPYKIIQKRLTEIEVSAAVLYLLIKSMVTSPKTVIPQEVRKYWKQIVSKFANYSIDSYPPQKILSTFQNKYDYLAYCDMRQCVLSSFLETPDIIAIKNELVNYPSLCVIRTDIEDLYGLFNSKPLLRNGNDVIIFNGQKKEYSLF